MQLVGWDEANGAEVARLDTADITLTASSVVAHVGESEWSWLFEDLDEVFHGSEEPWTILVVPGVDDHGVAVAPDDADRFRHELSARLPVSTRVSYPGHPAATEQAQPAPARQPAPAPPSYAAPPYAPAQEYATPTARAADPRSFDSSSSDQGLTVDLPTLDPVSTVDLQLRSNPMAETVVAPILSDDITGLYVPPTAAPPAPPASPAPASGPGGVLRKAKERVAAAQRERERHRPSSQAAGGLAGLDARSISAWFGTHHVLDSVSLSMAAGNVTALIGPSGCGKSTFLRILNRMHELIPSASLAGEVLLDGKDIYDTGRKVTDARRQIGMVFQKPNPFPAMSIYDNVLASFQLTGQKIGTSGRDDVVETCLRKAGLWSEVRDRLRQPGGGLSGGQQQRLCIARALAIRPRVLLMDEPCSALDPTSTRRIEETISELKSEVTIVIVTHNMQQAARVSDECAFFLAEQGTPGFIVEHGPTNAMFHHPQDQRTSDYVNGRFG